MAKFFSFLFLLSFTNLCSQVYFEDKASVLGLNVISGDTYLGNGVSFCDFDNDGWDDITLASASGSPIRFFKNVNGAFIEQNVNIPIYNFQTKQINWVDFDNDGDKDLFVTSNTNGNRLYENTGNLVFQDITASSGLSTLNIETYGASWGDYNNDGYLDVFLSSRIESGIAPNYLYKNNGDGTFQDVTVQVGIDNLNHKSFCAAFFDFNNDGWQDIYVSNDKYTFANLLYKNNGDGTFTDVSVSSGTNVSIDAMTTTIADFNNDGWFDIYITNTQLGNVLFKNNGDETFTDIANTSNTTFNSIGWGAVFLDTENDMDLDLYVSGMLDGANVNYSSAAYYENLGNETFTLPNTVGFNDDTGMSFSNAIGDTDNDGFPEIIVNNGNNENVFLWKNQTNSFNNWLKVKLEGTVSNKDGIGSVIEISINGIKQYAYTHCGEGYLSQNSSTKIFGTGLNTTVDYVKVTWLSGMIDFIENINTNQVIEITEGSNLLSVNELVKENINIYPNPVNNVLFLNSKNSIKKYVLYNVYGQELMNLTLLDFSNNTEVDFSNLNVGWYVLKIVTNQGKYFRKIVKK